MDPTPADRDISLTVIVPARNAGRTIERCLRSLLEHVPARGREIIVVDNGSTDDTIERVRRYPVRLEIIPPCFVSASRNHGARLASQPQLAFIDSDCVVRPGWADAVVRELASSDVGVTGARHELPDDPTWVEAAWDRAHRRREVPEREEVAYIPAGNMAVRREVFLGVNGFDETLETGEDPDLCARIAKSGLRIVQARAIRCIHLGEPKTLGAVYRRERWHGRGVRLRYPDGRIAPITVATLAFAASVVVGLFGLAASMVWRTWWPALPLLAAAAIPGLYALRSARPPRLSHGVRLWMVYGAYFLGRARALPVALGRGL